MWFFFAIMVDDEPFSNLMISKAMGTNQHCSINELWGYFFLNYNMCKCSSPRFLYVSLYFIIRDL